MSHRPHRPFGRDGNRRGGRGANGHRGPQAQRQGPGAGGQQFQPPQPGGFSGSYDPYDQGAGPSRDYYDGQGQQPIAYGYELDDGGASGSRARGGGRGGNGGGGGGPRNGHGPRRVRDERRRDSRERGPYPVNGRDRGPRHAGGRGGRGGGGNVSAAEQKRIHQQERPNPTKETRLERLAQERVSRTLFLRNVAYETRSEKLRDEFEQFGEIREWFDAITRRGLVFATYYDIRGAEAARSAMHNYKVYGRAIDVHFSLPKEHDRDGPCDRTKNQGSLRVSLRNRRPLEEGELARLAEQSGAIKAIHPGNALDQRVVEFYDSRAAVDFFDRMNGRQFMGSNLDLQFVWDEGDFVNSDPLAADAIAQANRDTRAEQRAEMRRRAAAELTGRQYEPKQQQEQQGGRLEEARKVQDLLASLGNAASLPTNTPQSNGQTPQLYGQPGSNGRHQPPGPPPGPPPPAFSPPPAAHSQQSQMGRYGPPPAQSYSQPHLNGYTPNNGYPPQSSYQPNGSRSNYGPNGSQSNYQPNGGYTPTHAPPPSLSPPAPPSNSLPPQVLAMLQPQQSQPPPHQQHGSYPPPPPQSYPPPQQGYRPPSQQSGYEQPQHQHQHQQQQQYDPKTGDVGSLLAMLNR